MNQPFGITRVLPLRQDDAITRVKEALRSEGFGVLTEIDVQDTLKQKLGVDFRRYRILGACNPPLAHRALQAELAVGLMLPCNVIVYEGEDGQTVVSAIDPMQTVAAHGVPALLEVAQAVREKLTRVVQQL